ncbi:Na+/H+ antiporter [Paenibacillus methanolicus]|uniref:CPA1 family monovalent cation:H+ antiporter n=1 Tax=Paenibacillus methanolicus TaxID=582686 RepID=A0A5S5BT95_9BACL|nr:Na+/H+ antiporter [Paenibacillus methanolicus]TYP69568.1 CPA1 family monovalent cation:H+ antiporter [Paenibacillus methanolicus]
MELFLTVLALLAVIGVSDVLHRFLPFVPVPLIQIGLGACAVLLPMGLHVELEPELFFVLFIAPLLFNDGKRTPREDLWNLRAPILLLALGLVFATVLIGGYVIHWMIPSLSLPSSFALAAILSPTDAVAVGALAKRIHLPKRILRLLEGESLMNDASGLVAFKFAIAAAVTGEFSLPKAAGSFLLIAAGGLLVGAVLGYLLIQLGFLIRKLGMEDVTTHMLLQLLTPFIIFLVSEHLGLSGILAVVAGGVIHAIERDRTASPHFKLQVVSASTWSVVIFVLNGLVFVILGATIPEAMHTIFEDKSINNGLVLGYVAVITLLLIGIRLVWLLVFSKESAIKPLLVTAISGVRGAITLVGALSIPLVMNDGTPYPQRDLIIFLAAGVILFSLVLASVLLPLLTRGEREEQPEEEAELSLKEHMINASLNLLRGKGVEGQADRGAAAAFLRHVDRVQQHQGQWSDPGLRRLETELRMIGVRAEREELGRLAQNGVVTADLASRFGELLDRMEALLAGRLNVPLQQSWTEMRRLMSRLFAETGQTGGEVSTAECISIMDARLLMAEAGMKAIEQARNKRNDRAAQVVIAHYELLIARLKQAKPGDAADEDGINVDLQMKAVQEQRNYVEQLVESGEINRRLAVRLRRFVNELETAILED